MLDEVVSEAMGSSRFNAFVLSAFAVTTLLLSAVGVFGVFAFGVAPGSVTSVSIWLSERPDRTSRECF
jgi:hypothetical protein